MLTFQSKENIPNNQQSRQHKSTSFSTVRRSLAQQKEYYDQIINQSLAELMSKQPSQKKEPMKTTTRLRKRKTNNNTIKNLQCVRTATQSIQHSASVLKLSKDIIDNIEDNSIKLPKQLPKPIDEDTAKRQSLQIPCIPSTKKAIELSMQQPKRPISNSCNERKFDFPSTHTRQKTPLKSSHISSDKPQKENKNNVSENISTDKRYNKENAQSIFSTDNDGYEIKVLSAEQNKSECNSKPLCTHNENVRQSYEKTTLPTVDKTDRKSEYNLPSASPILGENMGITFFPPGKTIIPPKIFPETCKGNYLGDSLSLNEQNIEVILGSTDNFEDKLKSILQITPIKSEECGKVNAYSMCAYDEEALFKNESKIGDYVSNISRVESKYKKMLNKLHDEEHSLIMTTVLRVLKEEGDSKEIARRLVQEIEDIKYDYDETRKLLKKQKMVENEVVYGGYKDFHKQLHKHI